jgi:hypothetical protein
MTDEIKFTVDEAAIIFKTFEDMRICPLRQDSDKYCAAVLSIIRKLGKLIEIPNNDEAKGISGNDSTGAASAVNAAAQLEVAADQAADIQQVEAKTANGV